MAKFVKSKIKLEAFNDCLGSKDFKKRMKECRHYIEPVDAKEKGGYWTNDEDTVVIRVYDVATKSHAMDLILFIKNRLYADEIEYVPDKKHENAFIFRLWWD